MQPLRAASVLALTAPVLLGTLSLLGACLGEDVSATNDTGVEGAACRDDGTCAPGLSCASGLCVRLDGGASGGDGSVAPPPGSDGAAPPPDGGAADADAATTCSPPLASAIKCGAAACGNGRSCCSAGPNSPRGLECIDDPSMTYQSCTSAGDAPVKCLGSCDPSAGKYCCGTFLTPPVVADGGCGYTSLLVQSTQCLAGGCGNLTMLCQTDADCMNRKCVRLAMSSSTQSPVWGICQP